MKRIIKSVGYCCDGCGWTFCDFYTQDEYSHPVCKMFGEAELPGSKSLKICDKIYGSCYDGRP